MPYVRDPAPGSRRGPPARTGARLPGTQRPGVLGCPRVVQRQAGLDLPRAQADGQAGTPHRPRGRASTVGGPPRVEYEINDKDEEYFTLLREALSSHEQKADVLSARDRLHRRPAAGRGRRAARGEDRGARAVAVPTVTEYYLPKEGPEQLGHIGEIMNMWMHSADCGAEWTRGLIERIEGGAYTLRGERRTVRGRAGGGPAESVRDGTAPGGRLLTAHPSGGAGTVPAPGGGRGRGRGTTARVVDSRSLPGAHVPPGRRAVWLPGCGAVGLPVRWPRG
ncbi:hypothetical protein SGLAM104S_04098 [Streptomyces glaucescens]